MIGDASIDDASIDDDGCRGEWGRAEGAEVSARSCGTDTTEDRLLGGRVRLRQSVSGYRAGIDPVLLAAAVPASPGQRVLDVGAGAGAAGLCLAARVPGTQVAMLERDAGAAALARENAALAAAHPPIAVHEGDIAAPPPALAAGSFDHVMSNPPFMPESRGTPATARGRGARQEGAVDLAGWVRACCLWVRPRGTVTFVHRADRLDELVAAMVAGHAGGLTILPLWPRRGVAAKRLLVQGRPGSRAPARLLPGLVLHGDGDRFTDEADMILRAAGGLSL